MEIEVFTNCDSLWRDNLMHNVFLYTDGESTKKKQRGKGGGSKCFEKKPFTKRNIFVYQKVRR
jgi:hypothetical protein